MKAKQSRRGFLICCLLLWQSLAFAQPHFRYRAPLGHVDTPAFYTVMLTPAVTAHCQPNLDDIRLMDAAGKPVPYMVRRESSIFKETSFAALPVISNDQDASKQTQIVVENKQQQTISDLLLITTNMDAKRIVNVSGSDDRQQWFVVKEGIALENRFSAQEDEIMQTLSLPLVRYRYLRITIVGKNVVPFNIRRVGVYNDNIRTGQYTVLPNPVVTQHDSSNKRSYIRIDFSSTYTINRLQLNIAGPRFFHRDAVVMPYADDRTREQVPVTLQAQQVAIELPGVYTRSIMLVVENGDNAPLKVAVGEAAQLTISLLTYLEAGQEYTLFFGDSTVLPPVYDLAFFKDSVQGQQMVLRPRAVFALPNHPSLAVVQPGKWYQHKVVLWTAIIAVLLLLLAFTYRLVQEVDKRKD